MTLPKAPNLLFILIDDLGWRDLACYGSSYYETPNIDRLFREGMHFTDAYAACPVCSPTRASLLTGKYPARLGVTNYIGDTHPSRGKLIDAPYIDHIPNDAITLAEVLQAEGYETWHIGKWHLGRRPFYPEDKGFDINIGGCSWGQPKEGYFSPWNIETLENGPDREYLTDRLTDEAIHLIRRKSDKPFFMNLCYYSVHTPIEGKQEKVDKYREKARHLGLDQSEAFEDGDYFPCEHKQAERIRRRIIQSDPVYAAMIESLDENIGRLLTALEEEGLTEDTLLVFTSDNGGLSTAEGSPTCNAPLAEGKGWMYEGGTREPMIVRWPGRVQPGSQCKVPVTSPDIFPTFINAAGLELPEHDHFDGENLIPLLTKSGKLTRESLFWHYPHYGNQGGTPGSSIRRGDFKLIEFFEDGRLELYNLRKDIGEGHNLVTEMPELADSLRKELDQWRRSVEALKPSPNSSWQCGEEE